MVPVAAKRLRRPWIGDASRVEPYPGPIDVRCGGHGRPCSPDRLFCRVYGRARSAAQFIAGWPYSFVVALEFGRTSRTAMLDVVRLGPADDATAVTASRLRDVIDRLDHQRRPGDPATRNLRPTSALPAAASKPSRPGPGRLRRSKNHSRAARYDVGRTVKRETSLAATQP
jgi:hypothetical protein